MKQFAFLTLMTVLAVCGGVFAPIWAVAWYYFLALLRPQYVWDWALPMEVRWSLIAGLAALTAVLLNLGRYLDQVRLNGMMGLTVVFGILVLLSGVSAYNPAVAMPWVIEYGKILLMAMVACLAIERLGHLRVMALMILVSTGYVAWSVNRDYLFSPFGLRVFKHGYGGLDNNGAGLLLALGVPFAYAAMIQPGHRLWHLAIRVLAPITGLLMIHGVLLTYSRGAMVAMAAGLAWLALRHTPRKQSLWIAGVLSVAVLGMAGQEIRQEFLSTADYHDDQSAQSRFASWAAGWEMALDHPLLGTGVRNSNLYSLGYGADRFGRTIHNQYLQTAADIGIPAALVYLGIMFAVMRGLLRLKARGQAALGDPALTRRDAAEVRHALRIGTALEAAIVTFATGGVFLSLEVFEFAWLLFAMGGVLPNLLDKRLEAAGHTAEDPATDDEPATPEPQPSPAGWPPGLSPGILP